MGAVKRKRTAVRRRVAPKYKKKRLNRPNVQAMIKQALNKNIETKQGNRIISNGVEIQHNNFITISNDMLGTVYGTGDPQAANGMRIGDEINLKGVNIRGMLELNSRYSDVTCRVVIVKSAKGDAPTYSTLFQGICQNKMLDRFNTERYTILASKIVKLRAPPNGTTVSTNPADGAGFATFGSGQETLSRATKIYKMWIPGRKFNRSGVIKYENDTTQPKFFDYHMLIFAFANESVSSLPGTPWNVCSNQDTVITMYYKDA